MPFSFNHCDCTPLVIDREFDINDEELLAKFVGQIILGHFAHVKRIIAELAVTPLTIPVDDIDMAIEKLKKDGKSSNALEKRDGWVFQIISWLALYTENKHLSFFCQPPHDATAQHGIDGVAVILDDLKKIERIIITEDKCTENHRVVIPKEVWPEFVRFEASENNNKILSRVSAMLENLQGGEILEANRYNIYVKEKWNYRVGINRNDTYQSAKGRKGLFKGYDECVVDNTPHRRYAATLYKQEIRSWMESFCLKVIKHLESQRPTNV